MLSLQNSGNIGIPAVSQRPWVLDSHSAVGQAPLGMQTLFYFPGGKLRHMWDLPGWRNALLLWYLFQILSWGLSLPSCGDWEVCEMQPPVSFYRPFLLPCTLPLLISSLWPDGDRMVLDVRVQQYDPGSCWKTLAAGGECSPLSCGRWKLVAASFAFIRLLSFPELSHHRQLFIGVEMPVACVLFLFRKGRKHGLVSSFCHFPNWLMKAWGPHGLS